MANDALSQNHTGAITMMMVGSLGPRSALDLLLFHHELLPGKDRCPY